MLTKYGRVFFSSFAQMMKASVQEFEKSHSFERILPRQYTETNSSFKGNDDLKSLTASLSTPIYDLLDRGGKRWRPALCFLIADLFAKSHSELYDVAATVEMIHNATLIVDDIEDDSFVRRNDKCVHLKFGVDVAINAGNYMYFAPLQYLISQPQYSADTKMKILQICLQNMKVVHYGQAWDIYWHKQTTQIIPTEEQYLKMAEYKTGALSSMAVQLSCAVLNKTDELGQILAQFATKIGIAFQIQDDILNLSGSEKYKKTKGYFGEDIHEGKLSLIAIHSLQKQKDPLFSILKSKTNDQEIINKAIQIVKDNGSLDYAHKRSLELIEEAWQLVEGLQFESIEAKDRLREFAKMLIERDS